jgi:membrane-associated phospholipid phosphatase
MRSPALIFLLLLPAMFARAQNADINLLRNLNTRGTPFLDNTCLVLSRSVAPVMVAEPLTVFVWGLVKKDSSLGRRSVVIGATLLTAGAISTGLKYLVNRERPFVTYPFIEQKMEAVSPSFPSGHSSAAFSVAASLTFAFPKWYVAAPAFLWAAGVGYSRMELGVHYPTDVLAGACIGAGSAWLMWEANKWLQRRK